MSDHLCSQEVDTNATSPRAPHNEQRMTDDKELQALHTALQEARELDAPLAAQLRHYVDRMQEIYPEFSQAVDRLVGRLEAAGAGDSAPKVGELMPEFLLPDEAGRLVGLSSLVSRGPAVVAFHRGHWCPYCQINALSLARLQQRIEAEGGEIVAITPELQRYAAKHKALSNADFRFLSDIDNGYALSLNLAVWVGEEMQTFMSATGRDLNKYQGSPSWFLPIPATFVIARDGTIVARFVDPDYRRRMDVDELVAAVTTAK